MDEVHRWVHTRLASAVCAPLLFGGVALMSASCGSTDKGSSGAPSNGSSGSGSVARGAAGTSSAGTGSIASATGGESGRSEAVAPSAALDSPALERPASDAAPVEPSLDAGREDPPIVALFNGVDLTGWTAYRETSRTTPGTRLSAEEAAAIFKPEAGSIRVYGDAGNGSPQSRHTLVTDEAYSKYNFFLEYSWGTKAFAPYQDLDQYPRDAGILFHIHGDETIVWPSSIEFQIKEGTTGDIYALFARCTSLGLGENGATFVSADNGGSSTLVDGANGYVQHSRSDNVELPEWNSLELRVNGGAATFLVNGQIVNQVLSVNDRSGMVGMPIAGGPIALQAEHAEAFYRNVRIQVFP